MAGVNLAWSRFLEGKPEFSPHPSFSVPAHPPFATDTLPTERPLKHHPLGWLPLLLEHHRAMGTVNTRHTFCCPRSSTYPFPMAFGLRTILPCPAPPILDISRKQKNHFLPSLADTYHRPWFVKGEKCVFRGFLCLCELPPQKEKGDSSTVFSQSAVKCYIPTKLNLRL